MLPARGPAGDTPIDGTPPTAEYDGGTIAHEGRTTERDASVEC